MFTKACRLRYFYSTLDFIVVLKTPTYWEFLTLWIFWYNQLFHTIFIIHIQRYWVLEFIVGQLQWRIHHWASHHLFLIWIRPLCHLFIVVTHLVNINNKLLNLSLLHYTNWRWVIVCITKEGLVAKGMALWPIVKEIWCP